MADALASQFGKILASKAREELTMLLGAEDALQQLVMEMQAFSGDLRDAELRACTDHAFRGWLADVKDLVYDADDIIDYSRTQVAMSDEHPVFCYSLMLSFFRRVALRHWTGKSIRSVNERLERIRTRKSDLNLIDTAAAAAPRDDHDHRGSSSSSRIQRNTSPILHEPDIVGSGIEKDTSDLVGLLTREEKDRITVLAITGMGGVGKTTLAQNIYNHPSIKDTFNNPPPMWVCVSQQYSDEELLRVIIRRCASAGGGSPGRDHESFAELQERLVRVIEGKKFFLILDDVWAAKVWVYLLHDPLHSCATGSKVLITTRDARLAKEMEAVHLHSVYPLTEKDSWSLLRKLVFRDGGIGEEGEVGDIGQQIAKKCDGLPLAVKTIAGVLRRKSRTYLEWEMVLKDPAWSLEKRPDGVMGVLYLSYQDLPFELKQCFIFCSLFPEDHVFQRGKLTRLWVAEGFIAEKEGVLLEDVANDYYNELLSRSLLQREPTNPSSSSSFSSSSTSISWNIAEKEDEGCKMHDLLRSLAKFLAGDEYRDVSQFVNATNPSSSSSSSSMKLRHLFVHKVVHHNVFTQFVKEHESLRTLLLDDRIYTMNFLFSKLSCLRVIDFSRTGLESLPKSVGNLIHLRYLDLSGSDSLVELPETVGNLSNLQYLILNKCRYLKKLPRGIAKLYKLRFLDLEDCPAVDGLPAGIGRLQHLNCLKGFMTNEEDGGWCSLEMLRSLSQLRTLTITKLERALIRFRGQPRYRGSLLEHLSYLRHLKLEIHHYYQPDGDDEKQKMQLIFEVDLFPPPSLETFKIDGYIGHKFPSWPLFPRLRRLDLLNCKYLKQLPAMGQLPNLDYLNIRNSHFVKSIGPEFVGMGMQVGALAFPMLTRLDLEKIYNLVEWQWEAEDSVVAMPRLKVLSIESCPKLRCLPGGLGSVTTLTTLSIQNADRLSVIENLPSLKVLEVNLSHNLRRVSNLPALQDMKVRGCCALREVEGLYLLQRLLIDNYLMKSLPGWLLLKQGQPAFPMLKSLSIRFRGNVEVVHRCLVDGPDWPKIQHYPQVKITGGPLFVRYTKDPFTFNTNLEAYFW